METAWQGWDFQTSDRSAIKFLIWVVKITVIPHTRPSLEKYPHLSFGKDFNVVGKKMTRNGREMANIYYCDIHIESGYSSIFCPI